MAIFKKSTNRETGQVPVGTNHTLLLNSRGLIPVVIQEHETGQVLRLGYMDQLALEMSTRHHNVFLFRRSRQQLQRMGEKEGIEYKIKEIHLDRAKRSLLVRVLSSDSSKMKSNFKYRIYPRTAEKQNDSQTAQN